jgi:hypothetical protein
VAKKKLLLLLLLLLLLRHLLLHLLLRLLLTLRLLLPHLLPHLLPIRSNPSFWLMRKATLGWLFLRLHRSKCEKAFDGQ